jgi:hypothetical protein
MSSGQQQPPWLRGPIEGIHPLLQPVAHALIDAEEDVRKVVAPLSIQRLWAKPRGAASAAFHVRHAMGSLDRLFTYARGGSLDDEQLATLAGEKALLPESFSAEQAVADFSEAVARAERQLRATAESDLLVVRLVGRAQLPSNTIGLLVHAAEHTARHVGQMITTVKVLA